MRLALSTILTVTVFSCKTLPTQNETKALNNTPRSTELVCQSKTSDHQILSVYVTFKESSDAAMPLDADIHWKLLNPKGVVYKSGLVHATSQELSSRIAQIAADRHSVELTLNDRPTLKLDAHTSGCTTLWTDLDGSPNSVATHKTSAACNAIGTAAQGWYANGKLLKHSKTCDQEVVACGTNQDQQGWFVQKKIDRILVSEERCAWRKEIPVCITKDQNSAWYIGDQLVARDDECAQKRIECNTIANKEGWFTFKRGQPQLLVRGICNPNNKEPRTAKFSLNQKKADQ